MNVKDSGMVFGHSEAGYNKPTIAHKEPRWVRVDGRTLECVNGKHKHLIVMVAGKWHSVGSKGAEVREV
jgi:hypothetical protein